MLASPMNFRGLCEADFERFTQGGSVDLEAQGGGMGGFRAREPGQTPSEVLPLDFEPLKSPHAMAGTVSR